MQAQGFGSISAGRARRVAVVLESDPRIEVVVTAVLAENGFTVEQVSSPSEAASRLRSGGVATVFIGSPGARDGELLDLLESDAQRKVTCIIATTADEQVAERLRRLDRYRVITKPVDIRELSSIVRECAGSRSREGEGEPR
jgi:DNA-binding response OmpR family regulator